MTQFNRHEFPAGGGWIFKQPQFGPQWTNKMAMVGFDASVKYIISERARNRAISVKHNLSTDYETVANELEKFTKLRLGIPLQPPPSFFQRSSSRLPLRIAAAAADIKTAAQGTAVVLDWLTSGGAPVSQELAERRAAICITCPKNVEGSWYTVAPAELIKATLESRKDLKLETKSDSTLKSCDVCKCLMRLKVWTPLQFIVSKTNPAIMREFPPNCWIAKRDA